MMDEGGQKRPPFQRDNTSQYRANNERKRTMRRCDAICDMRYARAQVMRHCVALRVASRKAIASSLTLTHRQLHCCIVAQPLRARLRLRARTMDARSILLNGEIGLGQPTFHNSRGGRGRIGGSALHEGT